MFYAFSIMYPADTWRLYNVGSRLRHLLYIKVHALYFYSFFLTSVFTGTLLLIWKSPQSAVCLHKFIFKIQIDSMENLRVELYVEFEFVPAGTWR